MKSGDDALVIVQEYVPGGELFDRITLDYGVAEDEARFVLAEMLDTLQYVAFLPQLVTSMPLMPSRHDSTLFEHTT